MFVVSAEYELPHHIWVEYPALGSRFDTCIGAVRATVVTPPLAAPPRIAVIPIFGAAGLDGAFKTVGAQPYGAALLVVSGLGIILYGLYSFAMARYTKM